jgi:hypothetical protein
MNQGTESDKPNKKAIEQQARQELDRVETQNAADPNTKGSTNEIQPIATDEGLTQ